VTAEEFAAYALAEAQRNGALLAAAGFKPQ
jgi:hypothetical protein